MFHSHIHTYHSQPECLLLIAEFYGCLLLGGTPNTGLVINWEIIVTNWEVIATGMAKVESTWSEWLWHFGPTMHWELDNLLTMEGGLLNWNTYWSDKVKGWATSPTHHCQLIFNSQSIEFYPYTGNESPNKVHTKYWSNTVFDWGCELQLTHNLIADLYEWGHGDRNID